MAQTARSIKVELDEDSEMTSHGGAVLVEQVLRKLGIRKLLNKHLPCRGKAKSYTSAHVAMAVVAGHLCGGRGFSATKLFENQAPLACIFGLEGRVPAQPTVWRACCDMAGLAMRKFNDAYRAIGSRLPGLDVRGKAKSQPVAQRMVPDKPEAMGAECKQAFAKTLGAVARRCARSLDKSLLSAAGFTVVHGDATDLEVEGACFDAARRNHEGNMSIRMMSVKAGPVFCAVDFLPGASDEATHLPDLLELAEHEVIRGVRGERPVLALLDSAYAEKGVVEACKALHWLHIIGANQWRTSLEHKAEDLGSQEWESHGADAKRGWRESQTGVFRHLPEGWEQVQTVVVRRWQCDDELPGCWHYSFLYTDLSAEMLPPDLVAKHGYAQAIWMIYGTKQGQENVFKTALSDLGGHQPGSGRLGATQALGYLVAMAANVSAVLSWVVMPKPEAGIRLWRLRRDYFSLPAKVLKRAGRVLCVRIAAGGLSESIKTIFMEAVARADLL